MLHLHVRVSTRTLSLYMVWWVPHYILYLLDSGVYIHVSMCRYVLTLHLYISLRGDVGMDTHTTRALSVV